LRCVVRFSGCCLLLLLPAFSHGDHDLFLCHRRLHRMEGVMVEVLGAEVAEPKDMEEVVPVPAVELKDMALMREIVYLEYIRVYGLYIVGVVSSK